MSPRSTRDARFAMATPALLLLIVMCLAQAVASLRGGGGRMLAIGGEVDAVDEGSSDVDDSGDVALGHSHHGHKRHNRGAAPRGKDAGSKDDSYDNYVYSMSYQPEFCRENHERFVGCKKFEEAWEGQLTIHGLWPNRADGTWPSMCSNEALDLSLLEDLSDELAVRWPNIKSPPNTPGHESFWSHEWQKHGTCSGLSLHDYFAAALDLLPTLPTPSVVKEKYGSVVKREALEEGYQGKEMAAFVCKAGYLSEIRVCFAKGEGGAVGERMACPASTLEEDSCGDEIKIAAFDAQVPTAIA